MRSFPLIRSRCLLKPFIGLRRWNLLRTYGAFPQLLRGLSLLCVCCGCISLLQPLNMHSAYSVRYLDFMHLHMNKMNKTICNGKIRWVMVTLAVRPSEQVFIADEALHQIYLGCMGMRRWKTSYFETMPFSLSTLYAWKCCALFTVKFIWDGYANLLTLLYFGSKNPSAIDEWFLR